MGGVEENSSAIIKEKTAQILENDAAELESKNDEISNEVKRGAWIDGQIVQVISASAPPPRRNRVYNGGDVRPRGDRFQYNKYNHYGGGYNNRGYGSGEGRRDGSVRGNQQRYRSRSRSRSRSMYRRGRRY